MAKTSWVSNFMRHDLQNGIIARHTRIKRGLRSRGVTVNVAKCSGVTSLDSILIGRERTVMDDIACM